MNNSTSKNAAQPFSLRQWLRIILVYLLIPVLLLVLGEDVRWWQAWLYSIVLFSAGVVGRFIAEMRHPGLMAERDQSFSAEGVKLWDKVLSPLMGFSISFPLIIVAGLDRRFDWSANFPIWANILGVSLTTIGYGVAVWALVENRFFSGVVRIQRERGHVVCDRGPYQFIRHPGYAGNIIALPGMILALSSAWAIIPAVFALFIVVIRTALEDQALIEELPGYLEYAKRVKFRLFPWFY